MQHLHFLNDIGDKLSRLKMHVLLKTGPAFKFWNGLGILLGMVLAMLAAGHLSLPVWILVGLTFAGVSTILALAVVVKVVTNEEILPNNYHSQMLVIGVSGILLWLLRQPVLPYLDVTVLGVGCTIVLGRLGCLTAGCCHGRPARWGVRYGQAHIAEGFPAYLNGVRLLPVQAMESLWALGMVIVGTAIVLGRQPAGTALAWHVVAYGIGRFFFEFLRGDAQRPYWQGFSEAQWTALITVSVVAGAGLVGVWPFQVWHVGAAIGLVVVMIVVAFWRRWEPNHLYQLLQPKHIAQIAEALDKLADLSKAQLVVEGELPVGAQLHLVPMASTALGLELSCGCVEQAGQRIYHYTLSRHNNDLTHRAACALGELIIRLRYASGKSEVLSGRQAGVFHVLVKPLS